MMSVVVTVTVHPASARHKCCTEARGIAWAPPLSLSAPLLRGLNIDNVMTLCLHAGAAVGAAVASNISTKDVARGTENPWRVS